MKNRTAFAWLCTVLLAPAAGAADVATDAMQAAYAPYRTVLFRTNSKAQAESEQAIAAARQSWQSVIDRFAGQPPAPYERDAAFAQTLTQVAAVYTQAETQIRAKELAPAHETLETARDLLADLRRRNGVVVYSDHMNAYHEAMEHVLADGPKTLAAPQGPMLLMAHVGTLEHLAARLRNQAPPELKKDAGFAPSLHAVEGSVAALRAATLSQDTSAMQRALGALKGPYSKLFLKFG